MVARNPRAHARLFTLRGDGAGLVLAFAIGAALGRNPQTWCGNAPRRRERRIAGARPEEQDEARCREQREDHGP